jgi:hypothetical protein
VVVATAHRLSHCISSYGSRIAWTRESGPIKIPSRSALSMGIVPSDAVLLAVQAGLVAAPQALPAGVTSKLKRLRGRGWAAIPVASIVGVILMIRYASGTATWLTWLALIAVPLLAFAALAWMIHGRLGWARTGGAAILAACLFLVAWRNQSLVPVFQVGVLRHSHHLVFAFGWTRVWHLPAQLAGTLLCGLSCIALGVLLATVTPPSWLKAGIVLMSCADVWLIATTVLQAPNNELVAATPGSGLPQLQSETFGAMNMGYGDFFVAGVLGGVLAVQRSTQQLADAAIGRTAATRALISYGRLQIGRHLGSYRLQLGAALMVFVLAALFDLLFFAFDELPATVPVAATVIILEVSFWIRRRRARTRVPMSREQISTKTWEGSATSGRL